MAKNLSDRPSYIYTYTYGLVTAVDGSPWDGGGDGGGEDQADEVKVGAHDEDGAAVVRL